MERTYEIKERWFLALLVSLLLILFLSHSLEIRENRAEAQSFATNYLWQDSIATTTTAKDSFFASTSGTNGKWEQVAIRANLDIVYRSGAPDTASWSSRDWMLLQEGDVLIYGPATPLRRFEWKSSSGSGTIYMEGYKRRAQY